MRWVASPPASIDGLDHEAKVLLEFDEEALGNDAVVLGNHTVPLDPGLQKIVKA